eukprot:scaffold33339_cov54-Phaeocystis_antarctica.AAC.3
MNQSSGGSGSMDGQGGAGAPGEGSPPTPRREAGGVVVPHIACMSAFHSAGGKDGVCHGGQLQTANADGGPRPTFKTRDAPSRVPGGGGRGLRLRGRWGVAAEVARAGEHGSCDDDTVAASSERW